MRIKLAFLQNLFSKRVIEKLKANKDRCEIFERDIQVLERAKVFLCPRIGDYSFYSNQHNDVLGKAIDDRISVLEKSQADLGNAHLIIN